MADRFGDGWGSSKLLLMNAEKKFSVYYPDCFNNPIDAPLVCFDSFLNKTGDYVIAAIVGDGEFPWEVQIEKTILYLKSCIKLTNLIALLNLPFNLFHSIFFTLCYSHYFIHT